MQINRLDHLVLTVADIESSAGFYTRVLGMEEQVFEGGRRAVKFGYSKSCATSRTTAPPSDALAPARDKQQ